MRSLSRHRSRAPGGAQLALGAACCVLLGLLPGGGAGAASAASVGSLSSSLHRHQARSQALATSVRGLSRLIARLDSQVALIGEREAAISAELAHDRTTLAGVQVGAAHQRRLVIAERGRLAFARAALARQLRSGYESDPPDVVSVVLDSHGFGDLLDRLDFLRLAEQRQQLSITGARRAKLAADAAARTLGVLEQRDRAAATATAARASAVAAIAQLLAGRQAALHSARSARLLALRSNDTQSHSLSRALARLQAQERRNASALGGLATGPWAIPAAIVTCESGGQNLPPNAAGASGYYQFLPSTWRGLGGSTPAAYLASRAEQDRLAAKLWDGGRGASNWVCAGIVGIRG